MYYLIYKITNLSNGMIYVGKHKTANVDDGYMGSGVLIRNAIAEYGVHNFKKEILHYCASSSEMNKTESLIVDRRFVARADTYNLVIGGYNPIPAKGALAFVARAIKKFTGSVLKWAWRFVRKNIRRMYRRYGILGILFIVFLLLKTLE